MNPEDMVDLPSDEDEDAKWVTHPLSSTITRVDVSSHADALKRSLLTTKQKM
jgi:hypothetical protein